MTSPLISDVCVRYAHTAATPLRSAVEAVRFDHGGMAAAGHIEVTGSSTGTLMMRMMRMMMRTTGSDHNDHGDHGDVVVHDLGVDFSAHCLD